MRLMTEDENIMIEDMDAKKASLIFIAGAGCLIGILFLCVLMWDAGII